MPDERWLVVGLGNPEPQYAANRHNVGFMVTDLLAERSGARFKSHKTRAWVAECAAGGRHVTLAKPRSYMNLSGGPVVALRDYYKVPPGRIAVVHDDLDLDFETIRIKFDGGDNGHNGLRSITRSLGTPDYHRVRFGIGRPPGRMDPAAFVLRDFGAAERRELPLLVSRAADAVETLLQDGLTVAQNAFNVR
jgi:peptidyl-tRNA hydrolase, PTH1 family